MRASVVLVATLLLLAGCSHKKEYASAQGRYHDAIGTVANYAPILDASSYGNADKRVVIPAAQNVAVTHICTIALDKANAVEEMNDVEKRVQATFAMLQKGCCDNAQSSEIATATSCNDAVRRESAALATIETEAVGQGLPPGSILPAAPPFDPLADRGISDAIHKAATPTPEETKLATMWADPAAKADGLKTTCDAAMASDPKKDDSGPDPAAFIANRRAADTWFHCNNLDQYALVMKLDGLKETGHDAKLCELATFKHDVEPPASMKDAYAVVATKRCAP